MCRFVQVAIIIPAYNAAAWLPDCLASLRAQTVANWSAFVVDDGSTDATAALVGGWDDPRVHLLRQANAGVSAARNHGLRRALAPDGGPGADAVLFLDADDWLAPDALRRLGTALAAAPWAVAAAGAYAAVEADGRIRPARRARGGCLLERLMVRNLFVNGGQMLICREAIEAAGTFRADLPYGEDWEYWTRLAALGEFAALPGRDPVLFARERPDSAYRRMATDAARNDAAVAAIHANPAITARLGPGTMRLLRRRAEADSAWIVGRELIRHGQARRGRQWLVRSWRQAPGPKRGVLLALSWLHAGPFRRYRFGASAAGPRRWIEGLIKGLGKGGAPIAP